MTDTDLYLFNEGNHARLYQRFGAQLCEEDGKAGVRFSVWAPNAQSVSVIGDFNSWTRDQHRLEPIASSGIWSGFIAGIKAGDCYKFHIHSRENDYRVDKADPFAFAAEIAPKTGSLVWDLDYQWNDVAWMQKRAGHNGLDRPISIYEVHAGSWRRNPNDGFRPLNYRELAAELVPYVKDMGYTHVEFMPLTEHPFYGSWGYQVTGYFAPTSRYGSPQDLMHLIDAFHQNDIGVILDWVPAHFPTDEHGLGFFDGTHLYEHSDPRQGYHPDWNTYIYNYSRNEVRSFLLSSALFWLDKYHVDGLRVDGVASMLYLDYSREDGQWVPNEYGGRENLGAISLLRKFNETVYADFPDVQTIAEESTAWPGVSRPVYLGGLGFGLKWDMGWMHDTLEYFKKDPLYRKYHQDQLTFRAIYAFHENFVLSLSHDEVVHGKGSLIGRMPGDDWQQYANLRLLYTYMFALPGKKLMFMGCEYGERGEWKHEDSLYWDALSYPPHAGVQALVRDLNRIYKEQPSLHELDVSESGFEWVDTGDHENAVLSFQRKGKDPSHRTVCILNLTPTVRHDYQVGVDVGGAWKQALSSDAQHYGGSGVGNWEELHASHGPWQGRPHSLKVSLPPLGAILLQPA